MMIATTVTKAAMTATAAAMTATAAAMPATAAATAAANHPAPCNCSNSEQKAMVQVVCVE